MHRDNLYSTKRHGNRWPVKTYYTDVLHLTMENDMTNLIKSILNLDNALVLTVLTGVAYALLSTSQATASMLGGL